MNSTGLIASALQVADGTLHGVIDDLPHEIQAQSCPSTPPTTKSRSTDVPVLESHMPGILSRLDRLLTLQARALYLRKDSERDGERDDDPPLCQPYIHINAQRDGLPDAVPNVEIFQMRKNNLQVRECDWESFMNHYSTEASLLPLMDMLVADSELALDIHIESMIRGGLTNAIKRRRVTGKKWIQQIRINSQELLGVFGKVTGYEWSTKPHTFVRPFQHLIHFHSKFKERLQVMELEEKSTSKMLEPSKMGQTDVQMGKAAFEKVTQMEKLSIKNQQESRQEDLEELKAISHHTSTSVVEELRCYLELFEKRVLPDYDRIQQAKSTSGLKIRFSDLWYLFRPGELVFVPQKTLPKVRDRGPYDLSARTVGDGSHKSSMHQQIWRLYTSKTPPNKIGDRLLPPGKSNQPYPRHCYSVSCYYLDYNGFSFGPVHEQFNIASFDGEKDVRELELYPLRFASNGDELLQQGVLLGHKFTDCLSSWHMSYNGWSLTTDPIGTLIVDSDISNIGKRGMVPQHIEGEVIVDFQEALYARPEFKVEFINLENMKNEPSPSQARKGRDLIIEWADATRSRAVATAYDNQVIDDFCEALEFNTLAKLDPCLQQSRNFKQLSCKEDYALLPPRIFVYSLRYLKFAPVDVRYLKKIHVQEDAIHQLQLPENHKRMVLAAVRSHLDRQKIEKRITEADVGEVQTQDIVSGKGNGLLILLHGEPGVGKTATAEVIAKQTGRPLFSISCNIFIETYRREEKLDELFRYAHLWNCILLIDEADVFMSARTGGGNDTVVSNFLRRVEYYNGIVFLTTNRIGKLDPAITSRLHLILHYQRLGSPEIQNIFLANIKRLQCAERQQREVGGKTPLFIMEKDILRFAVDHYKKHPRGKGAWNGRQIRNAFVIATSLARAEAEQPDMEGFQPQLRYSHFQEVEMLTTEFNTFRAQVLGGDDSYKARLNEERDDDFPIVPEIVD